MIQFEDVAHLYLGCMVIVDGESIQRQFTIISHDGIPSVDYNGIGDEEISMREMRPILRPLSSMTEDSRFYLLEVPKHLSAESFERD